MNRVAILSIALACPLASVSLADTLTLRNGKSYTGTFISGNSQEVVFRPDGGERQRFSVNRVNRVEFGSGGSELEESADRNRDNERGLRGTRNRPLGIEGEAIERKYNSVGGTQGYLGPALSGEQMLADGTGRVQEFRNGSIYWSPQTGAHAVIGGVRDEWRRNGAERGRLGYPTSDEQTATDGVGHIQYFEGGSIYWHPQSGTRVDLRRR